MQEDLLSGIVTAPGRVRSYLNDEGNDLTPFSCTLSVYNNDLSRLLINTSQDLRGGSGVKVILDTFERQKPMEVDWRFFVAENHPDFGLITDYQKSLLVSDHWLTSNSDDIEFIIVSDSMEERSHPNHYSIEESWEKFIDSAKAGRRVIVDLTSLRPYGRTNVKGLVATGIFGRGKETPHERGCFLAIYDAIAAHLRSGCVDSLLQLLGTLNDTLRRGGVYKNGIVTSSMDWRNPNFQDYLDVDVTELLGAHKIGARLTPEIIKHPDLVQKIVKGCNTSGMFLAKVQPYGVYENVCVGLGIPDRGTCLIWRVNIAQCKDYDDFIDGMVLATEKLCKLHTSWRSLNPKRAKNYAPLHKDRQIGVDVLGLANALANWGITYLQLTEAIERFLAHKPIDSEADGLAQAIACAYFESTRTADSFMNERGYPLLERIHTIEPSQNHAYQCVDLKGFTTARSIFAPFGRKVRRVSESQENIVVNHGKVETASMVGAKLHQRFCEAWQKLMNRCGRSHFISFDTWEPLTEAWLKDWLLNSPLQTKYYSEHERYDQSFLKKQALIAPCDISRPDECSVCAE